MITEKIISNFKNNMISEELHLPHGTKSAKLVCHKDLDGVCSGISMVQQLVKQGIPKERIQIEFAQYGDENTDKNFKSKFEGKKGQYVGVTDFAKLPKCRPFDIFNKLLNFKASKFDMATLIKAKDYSKVSLENFESELRNKFEIKDNKFTAGNIKSLYEALAAYYLLDKKERPEVTPVGIENLSYKLVTPDFLSDHHSNEKDALSSGKRGDLAAKSPSEAELIANKYAPGFWSQEDIKAISMVDSAGYTEEELKNTIFLEKHFSGKDKKRNLATLTATVYDNMVKKDERAAKYVIMNAGPNLVSLYTTTLRAAKLSGRSVEAFNKLRDGDTQGALEIMKTMPKIFSKNWTDKDTYKNVKPIMNVDDWRKKNERDLEAAKTGFKTKKDKEKIESIKGKRGKDENGTPYSEIRSDINSKKGKIATANNFALFCGTEAKVQYSRYMASLYSVNGQRMPFSIRYWTTFFQVAKSPLYKGNVDFSAVENHVFEDLTVYLKNNGFSDFRIKPIIDGMKRENGGHKSAIWSFQGFTNIKEPSKELGDEYWNSKNKLDRAEKLNAKGRKIVLPKAEELAKSKQPVLEKYKDIRQGALEFAISSVIKWTNKLYPVSKEDMDKLKTNDSRFEGK